MTNEQARTKARLVRLEEAVSAYLARFEERLEGRGTTLSLTDALADVAALMGRAELADALRDTAERGSR